MVIISSPLFPIKNENSLLYALEIIISIPTIHSPDQPLFQKTLCRMAFYNCAITIVNHTGFDPDHHNHPIRGTYMNEPPNIPAGEEGLFTVEAALDRKLFLVLES